MPRGRIELPTSSLPMTRSTTELPRRKILQKIHDDFGNVTRFPQRNYALEKFFVTLAQNFSIVDTMTTSTQQNKQDKRAAALRDNLKRRKEKAKAVKQDKCAHKTESKDNGTSTS